uniref:Uncharacterized protein n=1 Tax=Anopheles atroparvus TaxID=41427 RepID=A0A182IMA1_ANOAO
MDHQVLRKCPLRIRLSYRALVTVVTFSRYCQTVCRRCPNRLGLHISSPRDALVTASTLSSSPVNRRTGALAVSRCLLLSRRLLRLGGRREGPMDERGGGRAGDDPHDAARVQSVHHAGRRQGRRVMVCVRLMRVMRVVRVVSMVRVMMHVQRVVWVVQGEREGELTRILSGDIGCISDWEEVVVLLVGVLPGGTPLCVCVCWLPSELGVPGRPSADPDRSPGCCRSLREPPGVPTVGVGVGPPAPASAVPREAVVALLVLPGESLMLTAVVRTPALAALAAPRDAALTASEWGRPPVRWSPKRKECSEAKLFRKSFSRSRSSFSRSSLEPGSELGLCCIDMLGTGECVPSEMSESESVSVGDSGPSPRLGVSEDDPDPDSGG